MPGRSWPTRHDAASSRHSRRPAWWATELDAVSEVEVTFTALDDRRTRVELVHHHLDRHGADWQQMRDGVAADSGWPLYLERFVEVATR